MSFYELFWRRGVRKRRWSIVLAIVSATFAARSSRAEVDPADATIANSAVVCLHTEYLPFVDHDGNLLKYRLVRELGRQAVLLAARDELGLSTRDETLGEPFPDSVVDPQKDLHARVRGYSDGSARVELWPASAEPIANRAPGKPKGFAGDAIANMTDKLEMMSRAELLERLRELGFEGNVKPPDQKNVPPDSMEVLLLEMNFVSQFAATRAAHGAIKEKGQSRKWLGVLVRAYSHLALMTGHHWKSDTEVFSARALLYAERLATANPNDPWSRAHRAYARALVGLHGAALTELDSVEKLSDKAASDRPIPGWYDLIRPYCEFKREPVLAIADRRPSLRQLAQRLSFEQHCRYGDERWLFDSAQKTASVCPEDYSIYAYMTVTGSPLAVGRIGAHYGPTAMANLLPTRIAKLPDLPPSVHRIFDTRSGVSTDAPGNDEAHADDAPKAEDDAPPGDEITNEAQPTKISEIVAGLREATVAGRDAGEPSVAALGEIIFEEQFVQAANYLDVAMNATESSHADEVAALLPSVKGHRYERYIESYSVDVRRETARFYEIIGDMQIVDPRGNMYAMMRKIWRAHGGGRSQGRGHDAAFRAFYDFGLTLPGFEEADRFSSLWWDHMHDYYKKIWVDGVRAVSPHSPRNLRIAINIPEKPTYAQISQWESEAGDDPFIHFRFGQLYRSAGRFDDAIRCFERSIELSPKRKAYEELADTYRESGQEELWVPTLERILEVESLGLEHAMVHRRIANDFMDKEKWAEAEPYALEAAGTWSQWGLQIASAAYEGMGRLEESEKWIRKASQNYPTNGGGKWYFWCRRTGSGDVEAALKLAESHFAPEWKLADSNARYQLCIFHQLENDLPVALADAQYVVDESIKAKASPDKLAHAQMHLLLLARALKNADVEEKTRASVRQSIEAMRKTDPDLSTIVAFECKLLDGDKVTDEARIEVDNHLAAAAMHPQRRCNNEYFIGRAYDLRGDSEMAKLYYERAMRGFRANIHGSSLAGMRLHGMKAADDDASEKSE